MLSTSRSGQAYFKSIDKNTKVIFYERVILLTPIIHRRIQANIRPRTLRTLLLRLQGEQVAILTPFDTYTGTLIAVRSDYVVLIQSGGSLIFVRIPKIETVTKL